MQSRGGSRLNSVNAQVYCKTIGFMLRIVDRYLARELLWSFVAALMILLLVITGATVADLLNKIAHGRVAADLLLALIGLRTVDTLTLLVPLSAFLGVQIA